MPRQIYLPLGRNGEIDGIGHYLFCQIPIDLVNLYPLTYIDSLNVGASLLFAQSLIHLFVKFDPLIEIDHRSLHRNLLIIQTIHFNLLDIQLNNFRLVAYGLNPDKLILACHLLLQLVGNVLSPLLVCICPIENGHLVLLSIDVPDQIVQTRLGYHLPQIVVLLVVIIEEFTGQGHIIICVEEGVPIMYFRR